MPAHARYAQPSAQLRLIAVRARAQGLSFEVFWRLAVEPRWPNGRSRLVLVTTPEAKRPPLAIGWPKDSAERKLAKDALLATRPAWQRAYDREPPTSSERALSLLLPLILPDASSAASVRGSLSAGQVALVA